MAKETIYENGQRVRIHLQDKEQDFLYWDVQVREAVNSTKGGRLVYEAEVVGCGPFQASVWVGTEIRSTLTSRAHILYRSGEHGLTLNYKITRVETLHPYRFERTIDEDELRLLLNAIHPVERNPYGVSGPEAVITGENVRDYVFWLPPKSSFYSGMFPVKSDAVVV